MSVRAVVPVCVGCGDPATRTKDGQLFCDRDSCLTALPGTRTRDKDNDSGKGVRALRVVASPGPGNTTPKEEPELLGLIRDHDRGELEPVDVPLGELPADASPAMRRVAEDIRLLIGLRLAVDEDRPLPYATRFCAERCGLRHHTQASRVLRQLVEAGVVEPAGAMPARGKGDGTKLYQAPMAAA